MNFVLGLFYFYKNSIYIKDVSTRRARWNSARAIRRASGDDVVDVRRRRVGGGKRVSDEHRRLCGDGDAVREDAAGIYYYIFWRARWQGVDLLPDRDVIRTEC